MWKRIFASSLFACSLPLHAQQPSLPEPQYSQQYNAVKDGQLVVLERQTAVSDTQSKRFFVISPSTRVFESISNTASPVRVGPNTHFIVRMGTGNRDPQTLVHLQKLTPGKKDREVPIVTYKVSLIPGGGVNHKRAPDEPIPIDIKPYGQGSLEITPQQPLEPGEYAFMNGHAAQCFGVDAGLSSGSSPLAVAKPEPPPPPKAWKIDKLPEIGNSGQDIVQTAAILEGQSTVGGKTGGAYLVMHCGFPTPYYPDLLPLETILAGTDEMFTAPGAPGMFVDISDFASSQIGTATAIRVNANAQNRSNGARVRFFYDAPDMEQIVNATGQTLRLMVNSSSSPAMGSSAVFNLPLDNAPLKQMMGACMQKSASDADALQARTVASCPAPKDGMILDSVDLKYADNGRTLKGEMDEEDSGGAWKLSPAAKGHPVRRVVMACSYRNASTDESAAATDKSTVPVPATARSCNFTVHKNVLRNRAVCLSNASR